jgi:hypothetical protein
MEHNIGHQQILIKNNIVIAVLVFSEHDPKLMYETFQKFDYDQVIDSCLYKEVPGLGFSWDGKKFHQKLFESWTLDENFHWKAPKVKPEGDYYWSEEDKDWIKQEEVINQSGAEN